MYLLIINIHFNTILICSFPKTILIFQELICSFPNPTSPFQRKVFLFPFSVFLFSISSFSISKCIFLFSSSRTSVCSGINCSALDDELVDGELRLLLKIAKNILCLMCSKLYWYIFFFFFHHNIVYSKSPVYNNLNGPGVNIKGPCFT